MDLKNAKTGQEALTAIAVFSALHEVRNLPDKYITLNGG